MFWFRKTVHHTSSPKRFVVLVGLLVWSLFVIFAIMNMIVWFSSSSIQKKTTSAKNLSFGVDRSLSILIDRIQKLSSVIQSGGAVLEYPDDVDQIISLLKTNPQRIDRLPESYRGFWSLIQERLPYSQDLIELLWPDRPHTYLIALMNTAESRPNWWFFGSYLIVTIYKGKITSHQVYDSYYAYHQNSWVSLRLDTLQAEILNQSTINFISPNMYGFTYQDAGNIILLYEKLFPSQHLDGVIMIKSDLLAQAVPELKSKLIEWQFVNACIDLIRWEIRGNKKESYLVDITSYVEKNNDRLINMLIPNIPSLIQQAWVQVYIPWSSESFRTFLSRQWLITEYDPHTLYIWHLNKSFNKIDQFLNKKHLIQDTQGTMIVETNDEIIPLDKTLKSGTSYDRYLFYNLLIPQSYIDTIFSLTRTYNIELTKREQHILWLSANWHNQIIVHLPSDVIVESIDGDLFCSQQLMQKPCYRVLDARDHQVLTFDLMWFGSNILKVVKVRLKKL